jgi:hypothetical protein
MNIKAIQPMFSAVVTTADTYENDVMVNGIIGSTSKTQGAVKEIQTVVATGTHVKDIFKGDKVFINPSRYAVHKFSENSIKNDIEGMSNQIVGYNIPTIELDGVKHFYIQDRDIDFIVTEYEEDVEKPKIVEVEKAELFGINDPKLTI